MRQPKNKKPQTASVFAFVVDGETEFWYLKMLQRYIQKEHNIRLNFEPKIPNKKSLKEQYEFVKEKLKEYDKVFWIIDLDSTIKESREVSKRNTKPIDKFIKFRK
jgi:hypothetical protein